MYLDVLNTIEQNNFKKGNKHFKTIKRMEELLSSSSKLNVSDVIIPGVIGATGLTLLISEIAKLSKGKPNESSKR